jgi:hypothetical protein
MSGHHEARHHLISIRTLTTGRAFLRGKEVETKSDDCQLVSCSCGWQCSTTGTHLKALNRARQHLEEEAPDAGPDS